ncbi:MAG: DUF7064 domain-containing protein, partial [Candidatus Geothermincolia bacterium]
FGAEMAHSFGRVSVGNMVLRFGFLVENGRNEPVRESSITVDGGIDERKQKIEITMGRLSGDSVSVSGTVLSVTPIVFQTDAGDVVINEALTEYRWKDRVGLGIFETLSSDTARGADSIKAGS